MKFTGNRIQTVLLLWLSGWGMIGCGGGDGGPQPVAVAGEWSRQAIIVEDECAIAEALGVKDRIMEVMQTWQDIVVLQKGKQEGTPTFSGLGTVFGSVVTVNYLYQGQVKFNEFTACILSVQQTDTGTAGGEKIDGDALLSATLSGSSCPFVGEQCVLRASFSAIRCSPDCD